MTVAELIRELQAMPNQGAQVRIPVRDYDADGANVETLWADIDSVRHQGPFVEIETDAS